ncbi:hypothetical protein [Vibrio vulnificus]|uniref:hypothetical protein n=1 Tax=Vibrio vulnificus TaxID=672 RepID=UPI0019D4498F|nr:hypothetical protein [Vibrio vulnificus]MBN8093007.1 hypothetical protein [Vibrio vulnificus]HAS6053339.1 hypothetical protein [Vibrio vulnificus]HDY7893744.1 hypothetical protein [Vibrio vulnificus]
MFKLSFACSALTTHICSMRWGTYPFNCIPSYDPSGKLLEMVTLDHNEQQLGKAWYEYDVASR